MGLASALAAFTKGWDEVEFNKILGWLRETEVHLEAAANLPLAVPGDSARAPGPREYQAVRFLMCLFGPAKLQMEEEELLQRSVLQEQAVTKFLGKPDYNGLTEFQVSFACITKNVLT